MDKLYKAIQVLEDQINYSVRNMDEVVVELDFESADVILELLKEQQPKWIPINERKPNSCGVYIVARWFIEGCRRKILTDACYFDGSNTWHDDTRVNHSRPYLTDKIVAWMPLPNPPKDGEQK